MELTEIIERYQIAMNTVYRGVNTILKEKIHSEITTDQFSTLQYVQKNDRCTSTEIAQAFGIGKSAVTAQITRLFDKELIERTRDENDRRIVYLHLTRKGLEHVVYTEKKLYAAIGKQLANFDKKEILEFIQSLEKLAQIMEKK